MLNINTAVIALPFLSVQEELLFIALAPTLEAAL
jgi:hypothetical protein